MTLAHRAKHFGSFAAGEKFLRATSILGQFERKFAEIEEEDVDQMLEYLEDGLFLFPHKKFESRRNKYESVGLEPTEGGAPADLGSVAKQPTVGREATTNIKNNNINLSVKEQGRGVGEPKPMFEVSSVLKKASYTKSAQSGYAARSSFQRINRAKDERRLRGLIL